MNRIFSKFYANIQLTDSQEKDAKHKYSGVCEVLHKYYYEDTKYDGSTKLLFGSYGKKTHIRPARDVDMLFKLPPSLFEQYNDNQSNGQSQLLQDMRKVLKSTYPDTEIKADGKVVAVRFAEGSHNVEVLPAWEQQGGTFCIPDSTDGGRWEYGFDPKTEMQKIQNSESQTNNTRFLIRVVKKWSENCTANVKSYDIEQKVLSFFALGERERIHKSTLVRDFFDFFYTTETQEGLRSHLSTALTRANKALGFERDGKMENASIEWRKVFGDDFPKSKDDEKGKGVMSSPDPRPINPATATPPYYRHGDNKQQQSKYQLTEQDLLYIRDRYVKLPKHRICFALKNFGGDRKILGRNYLYINLPFYRKYEGKSIEENYYLKIDFNYMEGDVLPLVFDVKKRVRKVAKKDNLRLEDMHVYEDNMLCITLPEFVREKKMKNGFDLEIFFEDVLEEVLYWHAYYEKYGHEPWKALPHGYDGMKDAVERYKIGNRKYRRKILSKKK